MGLKDRKVFISTLVSKLRIYLPIRIRDYLKVKKHDQILFIINGDDVIIKKFDDELFNKIMGRK